MATGACFDIWARSARSDGKQGVGEIDKLIQEELVKFTSLDEQSMAGQGLAPEPAAGARPLDADNFVDPSSWADDLVGDPLAARLPGDVAPVGARPSAIPVSLADELEGDDGPIPPAPAPPGDKPNPPPTSLVHGQGRAGTFAQLAPPPPPPKGFPVGAVVGVLVLLAAVAGGLYFAGVLR